MNSIFRTSGRWSAETCKTSCMLAQGRFDDVRPEEWTPSYAGSSSRMDFLLKPEKLVVETKMTRKNLDQKRVAEELTIDKGRYRKHSDCETLVAFVYDPEGRCTNPAALETDLSEEGNGLRV